MKVLSIESRDTYVIFELSLKQINYLKEIFDYVSPINYNKDEQPELREALQYLEETLYPQLDHIVEKVKDWCMLQLKDRIYIDQ